MKSLVLILFLFVTACAHKKETKDSQSSKPYPAGCVNSVCHIRVQGYPQEVAVLIPPYASFKDITLYLQGYARPQGQDQNLDSVLNDFEMIKSFQDSKTNRIFILPFSTGKNKDYLQFLKTKAQLKEFIENVYKTFALKVNIESVHLIAHRESYSIVQNFLADQAAVNKNFKISQVTLLDATFPQLKSQIFTRWLHEDDNKMTAIYLKNTQTEKKALEMWSRFSGQKPGHAGGFNLENGDYLTLIPETEFAGFSEASWLLVRKWFGRVL